MFMLHSHQSSNNLFHNTKKTLRLNYHNDNINISCHLHNIKDTILLNSTIIDENITDSIINGARTEYIRLSLMTKKSFIDRCISMTYNTEIIMIIGGKIAFVSTYQNFVEA